MAPKVRIGLVGAGMIGDVHVANVAADGRGEVTWVATASRATLDAKLAAVACYADEMRSDPDPRSAEGVRRLARLRGSESGLDVAEAFTVVRAYPGSLP